MHFLHKIRKFSRLTSDIARNVPNKHDTLPGTVLKCIGMVDTFLHHYEGTLYDFFKSQNAVGNKNKYFVNLFYNSPLKGLFNIKTSQVDQYTKVVEAELDDEKLFFTEHTWQGKAEPDNDFWYTKDFNFEKALSKLWQQYDNRIAFELIKEGWQVKAQYSSFPYEEKPLLGFAKEDLSKFTLQHLQYAKQGIQRTYLFYGPPGTGKSTFALRFAQQLDAKTLKISAKDLTAIGVNDLFFVLKGLGPEVVVVDDIDRASDLNASLPILFQILSDIKALFKNLVVILTVNDVTKLDSALIRPGRVDVPIEFALPNAVEREVLLKGFGMNLNEIPQKEELIKLTHGLSAAYLEAIALEYVNKFKDIDQTLEFVKLLKKLGKIPEVKEAEEKKEEATTA